MMIKSDNVLIIITLCLLSLVLIQSTEAVDMGGEMNINYSFLSPDGSEVTTNWHGEVELEFYLPQTSQLSPRFVLKTGLRLGEAYTDVKYLYIRRSIGNTRLTLGRQPVSWSYGAVVNPLDYVFSIDELAGESLTAGIDGIRYFYSLGQGRSLEAVVDYPQEAEVYSPAGFPPESLRAGVRMRIPAPGYDLSFNAVTQKLGEKERLNRVGMTYKTDLEKAGIYGAAGYYVHRQEESSMEDVIIQLGFDSSFTTGESERVIIQGEYMSFFFNELNLGILGELLGAESQRGAENLPVFSDISDMFLVNLNYQKDMFSNIGAALIFESTDKTAVLVPYYNEELGGGLEYSLQGNIMSDPEGNIIPGAGFSLTYYF